MEQDWFAGTQLQALDQPRRTPEGIWVVATGMAAPPAACVRCGNGAELIPVAHTRVCYHDEPHESRSVQLLITRRLFHCETCAMTFPEPLPDVRISYGMTRRLIEYIQWEGTRHDPPDLAARLGLSMWTICLLNQSDGARRAPDRDEGAVRWLRLTAVSRGEVEYCQILDLASQMVLVELEQPTAEELKCRLQQLADPTRVAGVYCDLRYNYYVAVRQVVSPTTPLVVDRRQVLRLTGETLARVGTGLLVATPADDRYGLRVGLVRARGYLSASAGSQPPRHLTTPGGQRFPALAQAYYWLAGLHRIYQAPSRAEAERRWQVWRDRLPTDLLPTVQPLIATVETWAPAIFAWFEQPREETEAKAHGGLQHVVQSRQNLR